MKLGFARIAFIILVVGSVLGTITVGGVYWYFARSLPKMITLADYKPNVVTQVLGASGRPDDLIAEFYRERRYVVSFDKIPKLAVEAFISAEDDKFFEHQGINLASMIRASIANFRAGHVVQGGSTITQQVAKSLLLTSERSFVRKIKEIILAYRMESALTKQEILYLYLNQIYLGQGAYGIEAASRIYFNKSVGQLNIAEAAMIAGMPQAPSLYSPLKNPKKAKERQSYVLRRMLENKFITNEQYNESLKLPLKVYETKDFDSAETPYIAEHVRRYLFEKYGEKQTLDEGLQVKVTVSKDLSKAAQKSVIDGLEAVDKRQGYRGPIKTLDGNPAIEQFLREERFALAAKKIGYALFMPEGRIDTLEPIKQTGDINLLDVGKSYEAVVTSIDDKKKSAVAFIGITKVDLAWEDIKWAVTNAKDGRVPFKKGDVIYVKIQSIKEGGVTGALNQKPAVQGALYSLDARTGAVLAMVGGYDYAESEFNRATQALRQPGSAFKPFIYSSAIEKGYNPVSVIVDSPIVYEDAESGKWKPANFEEKFYGDTTLRQALIKSRNIPTIKIVQSIGVPYLTDFARRLGMTGNLAQDLSISLGSSSISLADLTRTYATFPRLGKKISPVLVLSVKSREGVVLEESKLDNFIIPKVDLSQVKPVQDLMSIEPGKTAIFPPPVGDPNQVLDPRVAYVMIHLMNEVVAFGTGHEAKNLNRPAAGKTGTTNDYLDAWFMGFTPHVVTGVWVGFDSQKTIGPGETGARAALPIWLQFMMDAVKSYPDEDFSVPDGIVFASIDPNSGKLAPPNSSRAIREAFIEGTEPKGVAENTGVRGKRTETQGEFLKEDLE